MLAVSFLKKWNNKSVVINITHTYIFNSSYRGLSPHKCKKKFCSHKILANIQSKSPIAIGGGGGRVARVGGVEAETMYNQITFMFSKEYHYNILSMHLIKFRKSEQWKLNYFLFFFYKTKQLTLFSFSVKILKHIIQQIWSLLTKIIITVHQLFFFKTTDLYNLDIYRFEKNNLSSYERKKILWIYIQLKYHQLRIRSGIFISYKLLWMPLISLKYHWQYHIRLKSLFWL